MNKITKDKKIYDTKLFKFVLILWVMVIIGLVLLSYIGNDVIAFIIAFPVSIISIYYIYKLRKKRIRN